MTDDLSYRVNIFERPWFNMSSDVLWDIYKAYIHSKLNKCIKGYLEIKKKKILLYNSDKAFIALQC